MSVELRPSDLENVSGAEMPVMLEGVLTALAQIPKNEKDHRSDRWSQKPRRLFVGNCLALRRQFTARRLAGCCRVDARFTLAFWTLAPWTLAFGHRSRRTLVAIGTGRFRRSSLSARDGARNPLDQPPIIQQSIRRIVQTTIRSSSMKFRSPRLSKHARSLPAATTPALLLNE